MEKTEVYRESWLTYASTKFHKDRKRKEAEGWRVKDIHQTASIFGRITELTVIYIKD